MSDDFYGLITKLIWRGHTKFTRHKSSRVIKWDKKIYKKDENIIGNVINI